MVLHKPTLTDALIEGGLTPAAAERAAEQIAHGYDEVAKQVEVDRRFTEQDRLNETNFRLLETKSDAKFETVEERIKALDTKFDTKIAALETKFDTKFEAVDAALKALDTRISDLREEINGRLAAAKASTDAQFAAIHRRIDDLDKSINRLYWLIGLTAAANFALFGYILSRLP